MAQTRRIVIVGNSLAGFSCARNLRMLDPDCQIQIISDEEHPAYARYALADYLCTKTKEATLFLQPPSYYQDNRLQLFSDTALLRLDAKRKRLLTDKKTYLDYEQLVIATGLSLKLPDIPGIRKEMVFPFYSLEDAKQIRKILPLAKTLCVWGSNLAALTVAFALSGLGKEIKLVLEEDDFWRLLVRIGLGEVILAKLKQTGVDIITHRTIKEVIGEGDFLAIRLDSGKVIGCSAVIVTQPLKPNLSYLEETGLEMTSKGLVVDSFLRTNLPDIYAAGAVCDFSLLPQIGELFCFWQRAVKQAEVAANNIVAKQTIYSPAEEKIIFTLGEDKVAMLGDNRIQDDTPQIEVVLYNKDLCFRKFYLSEGKILRAILYPADDSQIEGFWRLIKEGSDVSDYRQAMEDSNFIFPLVNAQGCQNSLSSK